MTTNTESIAGWSAYVEKMRMPAISQSAITEFLRENALPQIPVLEATITYEKPEDAR